MRLILPFLLTCALFACGDDDTPQDGGSRSDVGGVDSGIDAPETDAPTGDVGAPDSSETGCGGLDEGQAMCTAGRNLDFCEGGVLVAYECPMGSVCAPDPGSDDGTGCACDDAADALCPDPLCTDDPDCAPATDECMNADEVYTSAPTILGAQEGNANTATGHFLALRADLNGDPDRLLIMAFYSAGVETGTFEPGDSLWSVRLIMDISDGFPPDAGWLTLSEGSLEITSVEGNLTGTLRDAVFADDRTTPTCEVSVPSTITFDEVITCNSPSGCIN